ncbi:MAG: hypothetical protein Q8R36_05635, partial [bacterium]|nr:hypothetical protein [bacterium]
MATRVIKFSLGALGIALLGVGVLYALSFFDPARKQERLAREKLEELKQQYEQDIYGGDTPEETLKLFIDALKKEDIDLAAKYFVLDKQEGRYEALVQLKAENKLRDVVDRLGRLQMTKKDDTQAYFILVDKNEIVISQ